MKIRSIKVNFILNAIRLFLGSFFVVLTIPHISRVLGAANLGKVEYALTITSYFLLFSNMGISQYGVREIAIFRENKSKRTKVFLEMMVIMVITTLISMIVFIILMKSNFIKDKKLYLILITNMFFINFVFEWFYQGIEDQLYITSRYIIIRIIALILIFFLIKNQNDYYKYAIILVLMTSGSNVFNLFKMKRYLNLKDVKNYNLHIKKHLKPMFIALIGIISTTAYYQADITMIKIYGSDANVSYYSIANKLVRLCIIITTALNFIMLPRLSNFLKNNMELEFKKYLKYSFDYVIFFSIPMLIFINMFSNELIILFAGNNFYPAIKTLKILSFTIIMVSLHQYIGIQILYSKGQEKIYTISLLIGAVINIFLNLILGKIYIENGIAFATLISEIIILTLTVMFLQKKNIGIKENYNNAIKCFFSAVLSAIFIKMMILKINNIFFIIFVGLILGGISYVVFLYLMKYEYLMKYRNNFTKK